MNLSLQNRQFCFLSTALDEQKFVAKRTGAAAGSGKNKHAKHYPGAAGVAQECSHALAGNDDPRPRGLLQDVAWLMDTQRANFTGEEVSD